MVVLGLLVSLTLLYGLIVYEGMRGENEDIDEENMPGSGSITYLVE